MDGTWLCANQGGHINVNRKFVDGDNNSMIPLETPGIYLRLSWPRCI